MGSEHHDPMKSGKTRGPAPARRRVISLAKIKPLSEEAHQRLREAARDPKLSAGRRFPTIKD